MGYFDKLKDVAGKAVNTANDAMGGLGDATLEVRKIFEKDNNNGEEKSYEFPFLGYVFYPTGGLGMKTMFYEDCIEHGGDRVPYSDMQTVNVCHVSNNNFTDGTAQATLKSGKTMTFGVRPTDMELFLQAIGYANNKINEALDSDVAYKFGIQSNDGNAVEVYDDYLVFKIISGAIVAQTDKEAVPLTDVEAITFVPEESMMTFGFKIKGVDQPVQIVVPNYVGENAQQAVAFINRRKEELNNKAEKVEEVPVAWQPFVGEEKRFPLNGSTFVVSPQMDLFNSYRLKYRNVANEYAALAKEQYTKKVHDFDSFMMFFMEIYSQYLDKLLQGGVDILVAEGVWSETLDSFRDKQVQNFHMAIDDYNTMKKSLNLTDQANQRAVDNASSHIPTLRGGGFGLKGAMKGIATAEAFNAVTGAVKGAMKSATHVTPAQKAELFGRIKIDNLFNRVFVDYWNVYLTLTECLRKNGKSIWHYNASATSQAQNIMQNLTNPNFPQDKATEVIIQILTTCPYKVDFQKMLITKFGSTQEVRNINDYFGYTNFDDIHITG